MIAVPYTVSGVASDSGPTRELTLTVHCALESGVWCVEEIQLPDTIRVRAPDGEFRAEPLTIAAAVRWRERISDDLGLFEGACVQDVPDLLILLSAAFSPRGVSNGRNALRA